MNSSSNILGTEKISKLIIKFGIPGIISLVVNSIYNIVDQIFIGQGVGYLGNAATNVIYPLTVLAIAVGALFGDGAASFISLRLGSGKKDEASSGAYFGIIGAVVSGIILAVIYLIFLEPLCRMIGGTDANMPYALEYGRIISYGIPLVVITGGFSSIIRADGSPLVSMIGLLVGCAFNMILDPIFIFVLGWGVKGAAIATVIGEAANAILFIVWVIFKMKCVTLDKKAFKAFPKRAGNVLKLGTSSFVYQLALVIAMAIQNKVIVLEGAKSIYGEDIPFAAVGVTVKVFTIVSAIVIGLSSGTQPIYGFNYGCRQFDRVKKAFKYVVISATIILCVAFGVFQIFPSQIASIFGTDEPLYNEFAVRTMRIFLMGLPITALQQTSNVFFQSIGYPIRSALVSLSRQIIFMLPLLFIMTSIWGIDGFLYMGPVADVFSLILTAILLLTSWKKIFRE